MGDIVALTIDFPQTPETEEGARIAKVRRVIASGYKQISSKYRELAIAAFNEAMKGKAVSWEPTNLVATYEFEEGSAK